MDEEDGRGRLVVNMWLYLSKNGRGSGGNW